MDAGSCRLCGGREHREVLRIDGVPALCNVLHDDAASARRAPAGDIALAVCTTCGVLRNLAFDPCLVAYSPAYENSLHFSAVFRRYAAELAARLASTYSLADRTVLEIGCGKGDFLRLLCEVAGCDGVGYDPSYDGSESVDAEGGAARVRFVRAHHPTSPAELTADFVCSRHVLEHLDRPHELLAALRAAAGDRDVVSYHEVPNGGWVVDRAAVWDVIYEHPWYYTAPALLRLAASTGHEVLAVRTAFDDQFLAVECRTGVTVVDDDVATQVTAVVTAAGGLAARHRASVRRWRDAVHRWRAQDRRVAVWGIGSKGVSFLTQVVGDDAEVRAVDLNPRKHGRYVPLTAHEVVAPERVVAEGVDVVLVMNPAYTEEVGGLLASGGVPAEVVAVQ